MVLGSQDMQSTSLGTSFSIQAQARDINVRHLSLTSGIDENHEKKITITWSTSSVYLDASHYNNTWGEREEEGRRKRKGSEGRKEDQI